MKKRVRGTRPSGPGFARSSCADSQSVKAGSLHHNGYDGAKNVNGRKRHLLVDTLGLVLSILVTSANVPERKGLVRLLHSSKPHLPRLHHLWLDRGYKGVRFSKQVLLCFGVVLDVVTHREEAVSLYKRDVGSSKGLLLGWVTTVGSARTMRPFPPRVRRSSTSLAVTLSPSGLLIPTLRPGEAAESIPKHPLVPSQSHC